MPQQSLLSYIQNLLRIYTAPNWKWSKCLSTGKQIDCRICIQWNGTQPSKNELLIHKTTWNNLKNSKLIKRSQKKEYILCDSTYMKARYRWKSIYRDRNAIAVAEGIGYLIRKEYKGRGWQKCPVSCLHC